VTITLPDENSDPFSKHQSMAATPDQAIGEIKFIQQEARSTGVVRRPSWPIIVLRMPKDWTGPKEVDGQKVEGAWRSHQVPISEVATKPEHVRLLEEWMKSYRPEERFRASEACLRSPPRILGRSPSGPMIRSSLGENLEVHSVSEGLRIEAWISPEHFCGNYS
jgi:phosphoketolase